MDAYDWDKTVFRKDTTASFFLYCARRHPRVWLYAIAAIPVAIRHVRGLPPKTTQKQRFYRYFTKVPDIQSAIAAFWKKNTRLIGPPAMPCEPRPGDLIISAGADFLIRSLCEEHGWQLIATRVDPATGDMLSPDCHDVQKVVRFREAFGESARIGNWYSDSLTDSPMTAVAEHSWLVSPEDIRPWPAERLENQR